MANRFLSLNEITAEAMSVVPGATSEDRNIARTWAYIALREIGPSKDNINVCTMYPDDFSMVKPDDYHSACDIALFKADNTELRSKYRSGNKRIHEEIETLTAIEISEDDYHFNLSSNSTDVSYARLRYFTLPVDSEGVPKVPEYARLAIILFVRYMWSLRTGARDVTTMEASWKAARMEARGKGKIHGLMYKQFAKEWMSMIPNNKFDRF